MQKCPLQHPVLTNSQDIKDICQPLETLNITYFAHIQVDHQGLFSAISNNPAFHNHYINNEYYNADIHLASEADLGKYIVWDAIDCHGQSEKMNKEAEAFGIQHTFTIVEKNNKGKHYYHFSTNVTNKSINQSYIRNLELLKLFILHFNDKINPSKILSNAHDIKFSIAENAPGFLLKNGNMTEDKTSRALFLKKLQLASSTSTPDLSLREIEILSWLHRGKSLNQISEILQLAEITIKKHIAIIKDKTGCYTQFQLGEYFSSLI